MTDKRWRRRLDRRGLLRLGLASTAALGLLTRSGRSERRPPARLEIISRAGWGAAPPDHQPRVEHGLFDPAANPGGWQVYEQPLEELLTTIVVHHSSGPLAEGPREIQQYQMQERGFADIAYHFVVDDAGWVYEGRAIGVRGVHTDGFNTGMVGVVLVGNFEKRTAPASQRQSLRWLASFLAQRYDMTHLAGHRDFLPDQTVCPGRTLAAWLPDLAAELGLRYGTGGYRAPAYKS